MSFEQACQLVNSAGIPLSPAVKNGINSLARGGAATGQDVSVLAEQVWRHAASRALPLFSRLEAVFGNNVRLFPRNQRIEVTSTDAVIRARKEVMLMSAQLGFSSFARTRIATVVSELARNIEMYVGKGEIILLPRLGNTRQLMVQAQDRGNGIPNLESVLSGSYRSKTGLGQGLRAVRQVADEFAIRSTPVTGTQIRVIFNA